MMVNIILALVILLSINLSACIEDGLDISSESFDLSDSVTKIIESFNCSEFNQVSNEASLKIELAKIIEMQNSSVAKIDSRHEIGIKLNQCSPNKNSKALVISFAGTGSYNPLSFGVMSKLMKCSRVHELDQGIKQKIYPTILNLLKQERSRFSNWSGIQQGIMTNLFDNKNSINFDFASFASEESEFLANTGDISLRQLSTLSLEAIGVNNAQKCIVNYFQKSRELSIRPKLIILGHSSGARSIVKLMENLKSASAINADLVLTLDPVKEAHKALLDVAPQLVERKAQGVLRSIVDTTVKEKAVGIWSQKQPTVLYKTTNTKRWVSFYQNRDEYGLGEPLKFSIQGSPIAGAQANYFIKEGLSKKAHGGITYDKKVLEKINKELGYLFPQ